MYKVEHKKESFFKSSMELSEEEKKGKEKDSDELMNKSMNKLEDTVTLSIQK